MKRTYISLLGAFLAFAVFLFPFPALAQVAVAPDLKSAAPYAVLGTNAIPIIGTVTCTDTGPGIGITGQVGTTFPGGITNTGPCAITGPIVAPVGGAVVTDFNAAFASIDTQNPLCTGVIPIVTTTLAPGVYCSAAGTTIGAGVTLTLNGTASDVWVFRVGTGGPGALTLTGGQVIMGGAAQACNVYWKTSAAMTVTDSASFVGTVLSGAAATMTRTNWVGRVMATTDVTLTDPQPMTFAGCAAPDTITVNKDFIPNNAATVPMSLTCTSGTVTATPLNAAEGAPAVFTVTGALAGATCTATETVPAGYTANQANCVNVALNGSCTITNTLILPIPSSTLTLRKTWGVGSITGNTATVTSLGFLNNATSGLSTATLAGNTTTGVSVPVSAGEVGTISEAFGVGLASNYTATLACTGNATPLAGNTLTVNADEDIVCTVTNSLIAVPAAGGGPTLDPLGLSILVLLLAAAGVLLVNRMRM